VDTPRWTLRGGHSEVDTPRWTLRGGHSEVDTAAHDCSDPATSDSRLTIN